MLDDDTIDMPKVLNELNYMKKIQEIKKKYKDKIKHRKDDQRVYVYVNRRQVIAEDEEELFRKLYDMEYGLLGSSMADIFPMWMRWKRDYTAISGKTLQINTQQWNKYFVPYDITTKPLRYLTPKDFTHLFMKWTRNRQMTAKTFNNLKSIINGIFSYSINELEIVNANPVREIDMRQFPMKPQKQHTSVFLLDDRERLLNYLENKEEKGIDAMYSLAIQFDFYVTLRIGELRALKWENLKDGQIYIAGQCVLATEMNDDGTFSAGRYENVDHVKGNTEEGFRWIPLTAKAQEILEKVRLLNPDGEYIFMYKGKQLYTATFNEHLKKYCREIGIDDTGKSSHDIRFTVASVLYLRGMPITEIQRLLGHTSLSMTLHYLKQILPAGETSNMMEQCLAPPKLPENTIDFQQRKRWKNQRKVSEQRLKQELHTGCIHF